MANKANPPAKFAFRADGNAEIGSGHLRRCLSIAARLREWGAECLFICRTADESFSNLVVEAGFVLIELPDDKAVSQEQDAEQSIRTVEFHAPFDAVIVDHYGLAAAWETSIRAVTNKIVVIDDLADRPHDCDVLIDVAPGDEARYHDLVPSGARQLLGPKYALLRPEFRLHRNANRTSPEAIHRILISFGGVDRDNLTAVAIHAIRQVMPLVHIDAVVTRLSPHLQVLNQLASDDRNLKIQVDAGNMAAMMQDADLAIGAGGSTSWERACIGLPSIVVVIADNQRLTASALETLGCAVSVAAGPLLSENIGHVVRFLNNSPALRHMMATAGMAAVDGRGVDRISRAIMPPAIIMRQATEQDSRQVWEWRNDSGNSRNGNRSRCNCVGKSSRLVCAADRRRQHRHVHCRRAGSGRRCRPVRSGWQSGECFDLSRAWTRRSRIGTDHTFGGRVPTQGTPFGNCRASCRCQARERSLDCTLSRCKL